MQHSCDKVVICVHCDTTRSSRWIEFTDGGCLALSRAR